MAKPGACPRCFFFFFFFFLSGIRRSAASPTSRAGCLDEEGDKRGQVRNFVDGTSAFSVGKARPTVANALGRARLYVKSKAA